MARNPAEASVRKPGERRGVEEVDRRDAREREEHAGKGGPAEKADALDRRGRDVRGGELLDVVRELRQIGRLRGTERRHGERTEDRKRKDGEPVRAGRDEDPAGRDDHRSREVGADHHEPPREPIPEHGRERCDERPQDVSEDSDDTDRRRAAVLVCVDGERGRVRPVTDDRPRPRELDPPEPGIAKDAAQRPAGIGELLPQGPHPPEAHHIGGLSTTNPAAPPVTGGSERADDGTRTHDLLHGKQTL
jgi:hypothetical protein